MPACLPLLLQLRPGGDTDGDARVPGDRVTGRHLPLLHVGTHLEAVVPRSQAAQQGLHGASEGAAVRDLQTRTQQEGLVAVVWSVADGLAMNFHSTGPWWTDEGP